MEYITITNIKEILLSGDNPVKKSRIYGKDTINQYKLLEDIQLILTDGRYIVIPKGYTWDLASVPRILWWLFPPDSDAELAYLIHDYLYENRLFYPYTKNWVDLEMYRWSVVTNGTTKISLRNLDNKLRYYAVKLFGRKVWET